MLVGWAPVKRPEAPLTKDQIRLLGAIEAGGRRAAEIALRSGIKVECVYPMLSRLVGRRLLSKPAGRWPPTYQLTASGERLLAASRAYRKQIEE
jgi:DNA-binding IclR family transcriptional regulator